MKSFLIPDKTNSIFLRYVYAAISIILLISFAFKLLWTCLGLKIPVINSFHYSEFFINFQGGFVRRGLLGEAIFQFCNFSGLSPLWPIYVICIVSFILVLAFFSYKFYAFKLNWWILTTPFLLGLLKYIIRKDYLCYVILIIMLFCVRRALNQNKSLFLLFCLGVLGLFIHEAFIFFGLPICGLLLYRQKNGLITKSILPCAWIFIFLLLCAFKGNEIISNGILNSWQQAFPNLGIDEGAGSIRALSWTLAFTVDQHLHANFYSEGMGWFPIIIRIIYLFAIYFFITNFFFCFKGFSKFNENDRTLISTLFIFSIICLLPMFIFLSCDYGRLYQYAFIATISSYLIIPREILSSSFGDKVLAIVKRLNNKITFHPPLMKVIIIVELLALGEAPALFNPSAGFAQTTIGTLCFHFMNLYHYFVA